MCGVHDHNEVLKLTLLCHCAPITHPTCRVCAGPPSKGSVRKESGELTNSASNGPQGMSNGSNVVSTPRPADELHQVMQSLAQDIDDKVGAQSCTA